MALVSLGSLIGSGIGGNYAVQQQLQQQSYQYYNRPQLPEGWDYNDSSVAGHPVTFLAKLRHEIKEWHNNPLDR